MGSQKPLIEASFVVNMSTYQGTDEVLLSYEIETNHTVSFDQCMLKERGCFPLTRNEYLP